MNRIDLEAFISERTGVRKEDVESVVDAMIEIVTEALRDGDDVRLVGFATLSTRDRPARKGRNPKTGERITIRAARRVTFKAGRNLVRAVQVPRNELA